MTNRVRPQSETDRRNLGCFFNAGRHRGHSLHFLSSAGASTLGELTIEVSQAELEEVFERKDAGEPDPYPPGVSGDHRADLEQLEPDRANLRPSQLCGFEAQPTQCF